MKSADLDSLRKVFLAYGQRSRRGMSSVSNLLKVLDAISAPNKELYHARVQELPVKIRRTTTHSPTGQLRVSTEYQVGSVTARRSTEFDFAAPIAGSDGADSATYESAVAALSADCEYTDPDNEYWSGECATQQDIDDAYTLLAATESDADGMESDTDSDIEYCHRVLNDCWESSEASSYGGPSADPAPCSSATADNCSAKAVAYGVALANHAHKAWKLSLLIDAVAPPASAVVDAVWVLGIAVGGLAVASIAVHDCVFAQ